MKRVWVVVLCAVLTVTAVSAQFAAGVIAERIQANLDRLDPERGWVDVCAKIGEVHGLVDRTVRFYYDADAERFLEELFFLRDMIAAARDRFDEVISAQAVPEFAIVPQQTLTLAAYLNREVREPRDMIGLLGQGFFLMEFTLDDLLTEDVKFEALGPLADQSAAMNQACRAMLGLGYQGIEVQAVN